ncbi:glycine--tRNA ligase subunit beta [Pelagibacteraceae bacterium]|nr:glycine--tRNA ligase subunit beta [Pelagibacteraceae bacterium]
MTEFLLELYSEEIPPLLQINARNELKEKLEKSFEEENLKYKEITEFSTPTRLTILVKGMSEKIKLPAKEIKGPKLGVAESILSSFMKAQNVKKKDIFEKENAKGKFYFIKIAPKEVQTKDLLIRTVLNSIASLNWKKSMKWSDKNLIWGRPLRSILAIFNNKVLSFNFGHLKSTDVVISDVDLNFKNRKVKNFSQYQKFLRDCKITLNQQERENTIKKKLISICKSKNYKEEFNPRLIEEVVNIVENPNIILVDFNKDYLQIPEEIIISTLQKHQRYFPLFDKNNKLTNNFLVVANKSDTKNLIKEGNKRVVEARLSDAKFFWDKDKSKNLIKQARKLKDIIFYEKLGTIYDKTQRLRNLSGLISDELNINKEKIQIAASISKADLSSDLVGEYPELQGVMGKYFALSQGFEEDVANAVSDHYLPIGINSKIPKKPISYSISIVDKLDSLVGFFMIGEKPTSSKDPFALRRAAIGMLRIIIENNLTIRLSEIASYSVRLYEEQGVKSENNNTEKEVLDFLKERMRNLLKEKKIRNEIIEASLSSHVGDNYLDLFKKNILMNRYINKEVGKNAINSYKRASNIIEDIGKGIVGRPDPVLFRSEEEKVLFEKINEIRKAFTVKEDKKNYENLLIQLSETKPFTDNFFDNVKVNDENHDIKNNRLELLKMFCNTFNTFINFSKLEGLQ